LERALRQLGAGIKGRLLTNKGGGQVLAICTTPRGTAHAEIEAPS
jgi:hypothetical protein